LFFKGKRSRSLACGIEDIKSDYSPGKTHF
jgi:hypothetical protein